MRKSRFYSSRQSATVYDNVRQGHPNVIAEIISRFPLPEDGDILDAGCGTGNETQFLQKYANRPVWVVDNSESMLSKTKAKLGDKVNAVLQDFENLKVFPNERFSYIFSSFTYHQAANPRIFFKEIQRILRPSGRFVLLGATQEQARQKPLAKYCPSLLELDTQRYLPSDELIDAFWESGFVAVSLQPIFFETRKINEEYLAKAESVLVDSSLKTLKDRSKTEFSSGINRMRKELGTGLSFEIERTIISGVKPNDLQRNPEKYFMPVYKSVKCCNLKGGALNNVLSIETKEGKKIAKQGTTTSASRTLGAKLKSMSPERTKDEYTSLKLLNSERNSLPVRIPCVYDFDDSNNILLIEDISDHGTLMSEQGKEFYEHKEVASAQILGEFLGKQHSIFRNRCPFIRGNESRDLKKWKWILQLRTTDLIPSLSTSDDKIKSAIECKVRKILANYLTNTLVNPDVCPKNIFVYDNSPGIGLFDFEFCAGIGDPMYDLGFLVAHLALNTGINTGHFSSHTAQYCCDKYRRVNPSDFREPDVVWYAACTLIYRFLGASTFTAFRNHREAVKLVEAAKNIVLNAGGNLRELCET